MQATPPGQGPLSHAPPQPSSPPHLLAGQLGLHTQLPAWQVSAALVQLPVWHLWPQPSSAPQALPAQPQQLPPSQGATQRPAWQTVSPVHATTVPQSVQPWAKAAQS